MKKLSTFVLLALAVNLAPAQTRISEYNPSYTAGSNDLLIIDVWNGSGWNTRRIAISNFVAAIFQNPVFTTPQGGKVLVTNQNSGDTWLQIVTPGSTNSVGVKFQNGGLLDGADFYYMKPHGADPLGELITVSANSMAESAGATVPTAAARQHQHNIGWPYGWDYWQTQPSTNNGVYPQPGCSGVLMFKGEYFSSSSGGPHAGGSASGYPALHLPLAQTNGDYELTFYDTFDPNGTAGATNYNYANSRARMTIKGGASGAPGGLDLKGRLIQERQTGAAGAATGLSLNGPYLMDLAAGAAAITFYTTNANTDTTKVERHVYYVRSQGYAPTLAYPPAWNTNGAALPASLGTGQLLRLELESTGTTETNVQVVAAAVLSDHAYFTDPDALKFTTAAGISNPATIGALSTFVLSLKADTTWSKFTNGGCLYPFASTNAAGNAVNLMNTNANAIQWSGTVYHTNGFTGDGVSGYGDTGWTNSTTNGSWFACLNTNHTENGTIFGSKVSATSMEFCGWSSPFWNMIVNSDAQNVPTYPVADTVVYSRSGLTNILRGWETYTETFTLPAGVAQNQSIYVGAYHGTGAQDPSKRTLHCLALTTNAITAGEYTTLRNAIRQLDAALGR